MCQIVLGVLLVMLVVKVQICGTSFLVAGGAWLPKTSDHCVKCACFTDESESQVVTYFGRKFGASSLPTYCFA